MRRSSTPPLKLLAMVPGSYASKPTLSGPPRFVTRGMLYVPVHVSAPSTYCDSVRVAPTYV